MNYILFGFAFIATISGIVFSSFALICCLALSIYFDEIRFHMIMFGMIFIVFLCFLIRFLIEEIEDLKNLKTLENYSST